MIPHKVLHVHFQRKFKALQICDGGTVLKSPRNAAFRPNCVCMP
jgi:hypothetical protein